MAGSDQLEIEKASVDELRALQFVRAYDHVTLTKKKFDAAGMRRVIDLRPKQ